MLEIFTFLNDSLQGSFLIALLGAFLWGIASIIFSPCHISSIPLIIGFIGGQKDVTLKKAFFLSLLFSVGILITIALIGIFTSLVGRMLGDLGKFGNIFLSIFFLFFGLILLDVIKLPDFTLIDNSSYTGKGFLSAFIIGLLFGIGLGPCTFAFMAPMLGIVFRVSSSSLFSGILLLTFFAIGHTGIIVLAGTFSEVVERYLHWNESSKAVLMIRRICGILVILAGVYNFIR